MLACLAICWTWYAPDTDGEARNRFAEGDLEMQEGRSMARIIEGFDED